MRHRERCHCKGGKGELECERNAKTRPFERTNERTNVRFASDTISLRTLNLRNLARETIGSPDFVARAKRLTHSPVSAVLRVSIARTFNLTTYLSRNFHVGGYDRKQTPSYGIPSRAAIPLISTEFAFLPRSTRSPLKLCCSIGATVFRSRKMHQQRMSDSVRRLAEMGKPRLIYQIGMYSMFCIYLDDSKKSDSFPWRRKIQR
jgi:hypothetical protein